MADTYEYDDQNIFAKILRGEIPNTTVLETDHSLARPSGPRCRAAQALRTIVARTALVRGPDAQPLTL